MKMQGGEEAFHLLSLGNPLLRFGTSDLSAWWMGKLTSHKGGEGKWGGKEKLKYSLPSKGILVKKNKERCGKSVVCPNK